MMRQVMLLVVLLFSVGVAQAQDNRIQAPIIAFHENKLYTVSAADGSAQVLVEPPAGETFYMGENAGMSPDGQHLVYATHNDPESMTGYAVRLYVLDITTGQSEIFQPGGNVFDIKPRRGYHFLVGNLTWSVDGSRLYYVRFAVDDGGHGKLAENQLAYYDMRTQTHKLVARLNPKRHVHQLLAVEAGVVVHFVVTLGAAEPVVLYAADNRLVSQNTIGSLYPYTVRYQDHDYYAKGRPHGGIDSIINIETGEQQMLGDTYFPAMRSRPAGDQSLQVIRIIGDIQNWFRVIGADRKTSLIQIDEGHGVHFAVAPDGQSVAYLQYEQNGKAPIRIMAADGKVRELPFIAEEIFWSAPEHVVLYQAARG